MATAGQGGARGGWKFAEQSSMFSALRRPSSWRCAARRHVAHAWGGGRAGRGPSGDLSELILGSGRGGNQRAPKLIIPGGRSGGPPPPTSPGQLIIPEQGGSLADVGDSITTTTPPSRYRPPAGFMDEAGIHDDETMSMPAEVILNKLRSRAARWYTLAKYIPSLYKQAYTSSMIDEISGITPADQSKLVVAGTVYDSLKLSGKVPEEIMLAFEEPGESLLYPFRYLGVESRIAAAIYLVQQGYDPEECEVLARAMKEWERRPTERTGFSEHPGDCLAFKYLRDALEMRNVTEMAAKVELGMKVAVTDGARARLQEILSEAESTTSSVGLAGRSVYSPASMMLIRLNEDEIGNRAVPLLGPLGQVTLSHVETAPRASQDGPFGVITLIGPSAAASRWVALPQWKALSLAVHPVAIEVPDCSKVPAILLGTKSKTDEDRKRLQGPGILVFDVGQSESSPQSYYLAGPPERLELVDGARLAALGGTAAASLIFLCRPPARGALAEAAGQPELQL